MASNGWQTPFRRTVADLVTAAEPSNAAPVDPDAVHLLVPVMPWDWEVEPTGGTAAAQIAFCDTMPASCSPASEYAASSASFAAAYSAFLDLLVDFTPPALLESALGAVAPPAGDPAASASPPGWTKTTDGAGILRWAPDWLLGSSPQRWMVANRKMPAQSADVPLDATPTPLVADESPLPVDTAAPLAVSGVGWSRVPVYPGAWYSSSVVSLGRGGPFAGNRRQATVIGPAGILRCRVSTLIVAAQVSISVKLSTSAIADQVEAADEVQLGPLTADAAGAADAPTAVVVEEALTVSTPAGDPYVVGVMYAQP